MADEINLFDGSYFDAAKFNRRPDVQTLDRLIDKGFHQDRTLKECPGAEDDDSNQCQGS